MSILGGAKARVSSDHMYDTNQKCTALNDRQLVARSKFGQGEKSVDLKRDEEFVVCDDKKECLILIGGCVRVSLQTASNSVRCIESKLNFLAFNTNGAMANLSLRC